MESINALAVANYFVELARRDGRELTLPRMLALTYIAHGFSLAVLHRGLLDPRFDWVEAWDRMYSSPLRETREDEGEDAEKLAESVWRRFWKPRR